MIHSPTPQSRNSGPIRSELGPGINYSPWTSTLPSLAFCYSSEKKQSDRLSPSLRILNKVLCTSAGWAHLELKSEWTIIFSPPPFLWETHQTWLGWSLPKGAVAPPVGRGRQLCSSQQQSAHWRFFFPVFQCHLATVIYLGDRSNRWMCRLLLACELLGAGTTCVLFNA